MLGKQLAILLQICSSICNSPTIVCVISCCLWCTFLLRSKGVILNISSFSGMFPVPLLTIYSATKVNKVLVTHVRVRMNFEYQKRA